MRVAIRMLPRGLTRTTTPRRYLYHLRWHCHSPVHATPRLTTPPPPAFQPLPHFLPRHLAGRGLFRHLRSAPHLPFYYCPGTAREREFLPYLSSARYLPVQWYCTYLTYMRQAPPLPTLCTRWADGTRQAGRACRVLPPPACGVANHGCNGRAFLLWRLTPPSRDTHTARYTQAFSFRQAVHALAHRLPMPTFSMTAFVAELLLFSHPSTTSSVQFASLPTSTGLALPGIIPPHMPSFVPRLFHSSCEVWKLLYLPGGR